MTTDPTRNDHLERASAWVDRSGARLLVGGELVSSSATSPTTDPSTGEVLTEVPVARDAEIDRAIEAGAAAQDAWWSLGSAGRRQRLEALGQVVAEHAGELAMLDALDSGNPYEGMLNDVERSIHQFTTWPAVAAMVGGGETFPLDPARLHYTQLEPYGVVARISAYNHPAYFAIKSILPPLVMGNSVVLKPAEQTPLSALRLGELAAEILPPGTLSVLSGDGLTGDAIVRHPAIKRIGFTGSVATGRRIQASAAETGVKHVSLELGGKNAMVVFADADVAAVADAAVRGMNLEICAGQSCGSTSRVFAHESICAELVEAIAARTASMRLGRAYDDGTDMGPLITESHRDRVLSHVDTARDDGARLVTGGRDLPADLDGGYFMAPTVLAGVEQSMRVANDELFGPVVSVLSWSDHDTMLRQVNAVEYGLTAAIWTNDLDLALRTVRGIDTGYVWVNDVSSHYFGLPFGGTKESGLGREESISELQSYAEAKAVSIRTLPAR